MALFVRRAQPLSAQRVTSACVIDTRLGPAAAGPGDLILTDRAGERQVVRRVQLAHFYFPVDADAEFLLGLIAVEQAHPAIRVPPTHREPAEGPKIAPGGQPGAAEAIGADRGANGDR